MLSEGFILKRENRNNKDIYIQLIALQRTTKAKETGY